MTITAQAQCPVPGSDGALTLAANSGTVIFDPVALSIGDANNVFCFTSVNIGDSTTLVFYANKMRNPNSPVFFYVQGAFTLGGSSVLNLRGESSALEFTFPAINSGVSLQQQLQLRRPAIPGPGGFPGGLGQSGGVGAEAGGGPGGGQPGLVAGDSTCYGGSAAHFTAAFDPYSLGTQVSTTTYANVNLLPMYGGSGGGGGGGTSSSDFGGPGGAGGGAIRIVAASFSFSSGAQIVANGGAAYQITPQMKCAGGAGSAGSIHLVSAAPIPSLAKVLLDVSSRQGDNPSAPTVGGGGLIRISTGDTACNCNGSVVFGPPFTPPLQTGTPSLRIVSIGGQSVPAQAGGSYLSPDVVLNTSSAVTIQIASSNIPVGTVVKLRITNEAQVDQTISCTPLAGSLASATASCSATYAQLGSMSSVRATW
jgi:hypothetical protein